MPKPTTLKIETHHGVFMQIDHAGVLIVGNPGSGKSSLALELLHQQHQLIADDCIEFQQENNHIIGRCPPLLSGLLHQREIGLLKVPDLFGEPAIVSACILNYVIQLDSAARPAPSLHAARKFYSVLKQDFPLLVLNPNNPAHLSRRLTTWLAMQKHKIAPPFYDQKHNTSQGCSR